MNKISDIRVLSGYRILVNFETGEDRICDITPFLSKGDFKELVKNGCFIVAETSNMGCNAEAAEYLNENITFAPGKAVNAGGVAVSGLEMSQNSMRYNWTREEVDNRLHMIMGNIHETCKHYGQQGARINYLRGANVGGFIKVAEAMLAQGVV